MEPLLTNETSDPDGDGYVNNMCFMSVNMELIFRHLVQSSL